MERILVIGATGHIGREVISQLTAAGAPVRALVRNPDAAGLPLQVEVVRGDLTVPESLDACLEEMDAVFLVWTAPAAAAAPALERIAKHVRRIVYLSAPIKTQHPLFQKSKPNPSMALHAQNEGLIEASGLRWTFLRPGMFSLNCGVWWAPQIRAGDVVRWPYADAPTAPIDERDIGTVAVRVLSEEGHDGAEYVLTGPESLSQAEQLSTIGRAIGRPLRMEDISPDEARRELAAVIPMPALNYLLKAWGGAVGQPAFVTSTIEQITGSPARPFLTWAADNAAAFRA
jgi:uncharacterized protein YbjT (DUF2867 family)